MSLKPPQNPNDQLPSGADSSGLPVGWKSLKADFGAVGDGVANDSTVIQTAMDYITTNGGTLFVEPGTYLHNSSIVVNNTAKPWRITGSGGWHHQNVLHTQFLYTGGAGAAPGWDVQSTFAFEIDHLKFSHNNVLFDGFGMDLDWGSPALDPQVFSIHDCGFNAKVSSAAAVGLRLNRTIIGSVKRCHFGRFHHGIRLCEAGGAYDVGLILEGNTFNFYRTAAIAIGGADIESVTIRNNVFEDPVGATGILGLSGNACYNLGIENNWFGDCTAASKWVDGLNSQSQNFPCWIIGNQFNDSALGSHLGTLTGNWVLERNTFQGGVLFDSAPAGLKIGQGNFMNTLTSLWPTQPQQLESTGGVVSAGGSKRILPTHKRLLIGGRDESNAINEAAPSDGDTLAQLILGQRGAAGSLVAPTVTTRAAIYTTGSGSGAEHLVLQAAADANTRQVILAAGTTPAAKVTVNNTGVGFHGATPVAKPTAYTQTYSTADRTHAARTAAALTNSTGQTPDTTIENVPDPADTPASADALRDDLVANTLPAIERSLADLADMINKVRADSEDTAQLVNAIADDLQAYGLGQ